MPLELPPPANDQPYFTVSPVEAGTLCLADHMFVSPADPNAYRIAPSLAFVLRHSVSGSYVLFDLGMKKNLEEYTPIDQTSFKTRFYPCVVNKDIAESLNECSLNPSDVDTVILSHVHWDHIGDHSPFTKAQFLLGGPSKALIDTGYPTNPDSRFLESTIPKERTSWLSYDDWKPIGPFERSLDYFGDGSLYLIDAAGHLEGHMNALVRTTSDGGWVFLGGDSSHDRRLFTGEKGIAEYIHPDTGHFACAHVDKIQAEVHLNLIKSLSQYPRVQILFAHDDDWYNANKETACWPHTLTPL